MSEPARPREETLDVLFDISQLLQTGLDRETLAVLVGLTESGVNPEALATVVKELRRESAALRAETEGAGFAIPAVSASSRRAAEMSAFPNGRSME
mmetsp:Transcript_13851/g.35685  ORF Transcript_13851/g.35685 Transcript_13851/m.35685 type:complete len:96 (+) Transcript_13851:37-324(+)